MQIETRTQYIAEDGTAFNREADCIAYEKEQAEKKKHTHYFDVMHGADLTEGRGYYGRSLFKFLCYDGLAEAHMMDYCYAAFGKRVQYVQGVSSMPGWTLTKIDAATYEKRQHYFAPGMSARYPILFELVFDGNNGLIIAKEIKEV